MSECHIILTFFFVFRFGTKCDWIKEMYEIICLNN